MMIKDSRKKQSKLAILPRAVLLACLGNSMMLSEVHAENLVQTQTENYAISAGSLDAVLNEFAVRADIMLTIDGALTQGVRSQGLKGQYTIQHGLTAILEGTGLQAIRQDDDQYVVARGSKDDALNLPTMNIIGQHQRTGSARDAYRQKSASVGALGNKRIQDTPFTIENYSNDFIDNIQARSISDVVKYDAGVSLSSGNLLNENNEFKIRGIFPDSDTGQRIDGLPIYNRASDIPIEHFESVEILKGAGGFLYGFGNPGGVVNYRLKRPAETFAASFNTQIMDSGLLLGHVDVGGRFGPEEQFGVRVNAVREAGDTYTDEGSSYRKSGSIAADWRITPDIVWEADAILADRKTYGGYRRVILIPPAPGRNLLSPINGDKSLAPEWARYQSDHKTYGTSLKWQFHENWSNKLSYRYSSNYRDPAVPQMVAQPNGDYTSTLIYFNNRFKTHHIEDVISGSFRTGAIEHDIAIGYSQSRTISTNSIGLDVATIALPDASGNLANPVTDIPRPVGHRDKGDATFNEISSTKRKDIFISDTLHFGNKWDLILGIRRSSLKEKHADYDSSENTPTYALVYRPVDWMSLYGSYIESLEQGGIAAATSVNASEVFPPKVSKQYEVGIKIDRDDWSASLALFQLEKAELYTDPVSQITTQNGEVNYQGVEASVKAMVTPVWMLGASAMLVDAENETVSNPEWEGESPVNIAETELRLFSEYRIAGSGLTFTGGASYTGDRPYDGANEYHLDSVSLFDMGARYETSLNGQPLTIRLNIENLTDEAYWLASSGGVLQGPPRTVKLGAQIQF